MAVVKLTRETLHRALDMFLDIAEEKGLQVIGLVPHDMVHSNLVKLGVHDRKKGEVDAKVVAQVLQLEVWFKPQHLAEPYRGTTRDFGAAFDGMLLFAAVQPGAVLEFPEDAPQLRIVSAMHESGQQVTACTE